MIDMILPILQLILQGVAAFGKLLALTVFRGAALLLASVVQLFNARGDGFIGTGVGLVWSALDNGFSLAWDLVTELLDISKDLVMESTSWVFYLLTSGLWELLGLVRAWVGSLSEMVPGVVWNLWDIVGGFGSAVWSHFWDAVVYILDSVR